MKLLVQKNMKTKIPAEKILLKNSKFFPKFRNFGILPDFEIVFGISEFFCNFFSKGIFLTSRINSSLVIFLKHFHEKFSFQFFSQFFLKNLNNTIFVNSAVFLRVNSLIYLVVKNQIRNLLVC